MSDVQGQSKPEETGLITTGSSEADQAITEIANRIGGIETILCSNFPSDPDEQYYLMAMATSSDVKSLGDMVGQELPIKYWMAHAVELKGTAESDGGTSPRVVLFTPEGDAYGCVSVGVFNAIQLIYRRYGTNPLPEGAIYRVTQSKTRNGWRLLSLVPQGLNKS